MKNTKKPSRFLVTLDGLTKLVEFGLKLMALWKLFF